MIATPQRASPSVERFRDPPAHRVMFDSPEVTIRTLESAPDRWLLVAGGSYSRRAVFAQTAYQIRKGGVVGFPLRTDGRYLTKVVSGQSTRDRRMFDVEFYMKFVPDTHSNG